MGKKSGDQYQKKKENKKAGGYVNLGTQDKASSRDNLETATKRVKDMTVRGQDAPVTSPVLHSSSKDALEDHISNLVNKTRDIEAKIEEMEREKDELRKAFENSKSGLKEAEEDRKNLEKKFQKLTGDISKKEEQLMEELQDLVAKSEQLKKEESDFKSQCKQELNKLEERNKMLERCIMQESGAAEHEQADVDRAKYQLAQLRMEVGEKSRQAGILERKLDDAPGTNELAQYQRRFSELENQMANKFSETQQFYTMYNTLESQKVFMSREVSMLNSILETIPQSNHSQSQKEHFLKQLEGLVREVKQLQQQVETTLKQEEKIKAEVTHELNDLLETHRTYNSLVRDMREELSTNSQLAEKLN